MAATDLCSLADVRARVTSSLADAAINALITAISEHVESQVGMWLAPRADTTLLFDCERTSSSLPMMQGGIRVGVRAVTVVGIASVSQPETGGSYTNATLSNVLLRPRPTAELPASHLVLMSGWFQRGFNTASVAGSFGPAAVSARAKEVAIELVQLTLNYTPGLSSEAVGDWSRQLVNNSAMNFVMERDNLLASMPGPVAL